MDIIVTDIKSIDISIFPKSICFSFFTAKEIRKLACVEIFCPVFFDIHGDVIRGGLCDEKMGIFSKFGICKFCMGNYTTCPGHFGYIDLPIPITNNFLRNILFTILKAKCLFCNFFRIENLQVILLNNEVLRLSFKSKVLFDIPNKEKFIKEPTTVLSNYLKISTLRTYQKLGRKKTEKIYCDSIKIRIRCSLIKTHEKYENWMKKVSDFLTKCKNNMECPKCGYSSHQKKKKSWEKINLHFFISIKRQIDFQEKFEADPSSPWITETKNKISFFDKIQSSTDFLLFQFKEELEIIWKFENDLCEIIWGTFNISKKFQKINGFHLFYIDSLLIPPNRYRPFNSGKKSESDSSLLTNPQNFYYTKILKANQLILLALGIKEYTSKLNLVVKGYLNLEKASNNLGDTASNKSDTTKENPIGIKQQLEKKNGIFRMHLMGKRVFHSARSIITPDPFLRCNEVGVPIKFSKQLTLPEEINVLNLGLLLKSLLLKTEDLNSLELTHNFENLIGDNLKIEANKFNYRHRNFLKMCSKHATVFSKEKKNFYGLNKIFRTLLSGDFVLMNRQPSLHRVSIMSHKIKVEANSKCIKLNYCNCNSYNADFDGDEMNLHVPQNSFAKTEAKLLSLCSNQYKIPVNECPSRGLIQDYILSSVILTRKDSFINIRMLAHLLYFSENFQQFSNYPLYPAILKPAQLWTGKQVISILWKNFSIKKNFKVLESRTKFSKLSFGIDETKVLMRRGELLRGIIDSSQLGKNKFGALHAYYELYGGEKGDFFLSEIGSVLIIFLRSIGYTLNIEDLLLLSKIDKYRKIGIRKINRISQMYSRKFLSSYGLFLPQKKKITKKITEISAFIRFIFFMNNLLLLFIQTQKNHVINLFSKNLENCIPGGLYIIPCLNKFSIITLSGAKGSTLNTFQLSLNLGQTELESKCTPRSAGGKTLPVFFPFDFNVCSNGFISNRFITGITQSEFYFHCMAGREGLLDTAVKTSQSGYIQRSLVKHLESIILSYDHSIRFSKGDVNQFIYSRNGCCSMNSDLKSNINWRIQNFKNPKLPVINICSRSKRFDKNQDFLGFSKSLQSLPHFESKKLEITLKKNKMLRKIYPISQSLDLLSQKFTELFYENLVLPGEAIGIITSQSLGEPCTQMTLNTFHFAGKLSSNQKSGIPRLKEILLSSSKFPVTPTMSGKIQGTIDEKKFSLIQKRFKRIHFNDILTCSSHFIEKNQEFYGQTFRFFLQKNFFYKHLLSLRMKFLKHSIEYFVIKLKKYLKDYSAKNKSKDPETKQNFDYYKDSKIKIETLKKNPTKSKKNLIENKSDFFKINLFQYQNILNFKDIDMIFDEDFTIKTSQGISDHFIDYREKSLHINGINFMIFWKNFDIIETKSIYTNDIYGMMVNYGIEACRNCLFNELESIFKIQGISISSKHFDLIADYMTRLGSYRGFNRKGFGEEDGFQEITYETAINYIIISSLSNKVDKLTTVSSRLSLGMLPNIGTGCFGITI